MKHSGHLTELSDGTRWLSYLVTGHIDNRQRWAWAVWPDVLDVRASTMRVRVFLGSGEDPDDAERGLKRAAERHDVTLQRLCVGEQTAEKEEIDLGNGARATVGQFEETYPIVHLNQAGEKWPEQRKQSP